MESINTQVGKIVEQLKGAVLSQTPVAYLPTNDWSLIMEILYSAETHGAVIPRLYYYKDQLIELEAGQFFMETETSASSNIIDNYLIVQSIKPDDIKIPSLIILSVPDWKNIPSGLIEYVKTYVGIKNGRNYIKPERLSVIRRSLCIVVTPVNLPVPPELSPYMKRIDIPAISDREIREIVAERLMDYELDMYSLFSESFLNQLVVSLRGFSKTTIKRIVTESIVNDFICENTIDENGILGIIQSEKKAVMDGTPGLKWENADGKALSGLYNIREWIEARKEIFSDPEKAAIKNIDIPNGLLVSGLPGSGKSLMAKMAASVLKLPLISFDMGSVRGGLVGQSEHNLLEALRVAEQMAPCVLWIDEIEKAFSGSSSSGDSGVGSRMFGKFLTWMQEKNSACFVFATSNDISALPPELFRSERFDKKFYTFMPVASECADILATIVKNENKNYIERVSNLARNLSEGLPARLFDPETEKSSFWLEVINEGCAPAGSDFRFKVIGNKNENNDIDCNPDRLCVWKESRQPGYKLMTGADLSALIKEIKFRLYSAGEAPKRNTGALYGVNSIRYVAIEIMQSSDFKPYGETNIRDIVGSFNNLYNYQFTPATTESVLDLENYDSMRRCYLSPYEEPVFENRYDQALYYVLVGAINGCSNKMTQE